MSENNAHGLAHVLPLKLLGGVLVALIALTLLTVAVASIDLGDLNIFVALGIATAKGLLVLLFFMHLKYERPLLGVIIGAALLTLAIFISLAMADTADYNPEVVPFRDRIEAAGS